MGDGLVALMAGRCSMRITKISVEKLFGIFDHEIPLNLDDRITIIHGPNGYGKTIILKMLHGLFNAEYSDLCSIPYRNLRIEFDDASQLKVVGNIENPNGNKVFIQYARAEHNTQDLHITFKPNHVRMIENDGADNKRSWFGDLTNQIDVYLIESQRLLNLPTASWNRSASVPKVFYKPKSDQEQSKSTLKTVQVYADEMVQRMQDPLAEYVFTSQALDRKFPMRVLNPDDSIELTDDVLQESLKKLERHRRRLIEAGLLEPDQQQGFQFPQHSLDKSAKKFLAIYLEDTEKKFNAFGDLLDKIELFKRIMNSKLSYKEISVDREQGFVFTIKYPNGHNAGSDTVSPMDLSSGEQHELVLLYELLFKVKPKSLVLIDEPELSLHIGWQVNFLRDLQEISKLADIDILIATHAPDLIADRWDLTVELKGVS
jgi:predicted ATPase